MPGFAESLIWICRLIFHVGDLLQVGPSPTSQWFAKKIRYGSNPSPCSFNLASENPPVPQDTAWATVQHAPGATLVLLDALEHLRTRPRLGAAWPEKPGAPGAPGAPEVPAMQRQNSGFICGKSAVEMEVHGAMAGVSFKFFFSRIFQRMNGQGFNMRHLYRYMY